MQSKKKLKKQFKKLLNMAYQNELSSELNKLHKEFEKFFSNKINCFELDDKIHLFHNDISRNLYNKYNNSNDIEHFVIAKAVLNNFILKENIPNEYIEIIEEAIKKLK